MPELLEVSDPGPDYGAALAALEPGERETVRGFAESLGLEPDEWAAVPGLRTVVLAVAALRLMDRMHPQLADAARLRDVCSLRLGCGKASGAVAERIARNVARWIEAADGDGDKMSAGSAA